MIDESEARVLLERCDLIGLGVKADTVRRRLHGTRTTFVRVFEIHVDAPPSALPPRVSAGEFRIVGWPASLDAAVSAVRAAVALGRAPGRSAPTDSVQGGPERSAPADSPARRGAASNGLPVTGFTLAGLHAIDGASFADICRALADAGLDAISEVAVDVIDGDTAGDVETARGAGLQVTRLTVNALSAADRVDIVARARALQETVGGFRTFAPLPRTMSVDTPSTGYDDVKLIALARLLAENIESIQVDWALYGPKLAQFALTVGADDVDGVAAIDPGTLGTRRSPVEEIRGNIRSASLDPVERNARYEAIG